MSRIGAVILAGGASRRLGRPKQLERLAGETLLARTIRTAEEAGCDPVVVVLGSEAGRLREEPELQRCLTVVNHAWTEGMGRSIAVGVDALQGQDVAGVLILTCDMPAVSAAHLGALCAAAGELTASHYAGRHGVPAYFPSRVFQQLTELRGEEGARNLVRSARSVPLDDGDLDIDTPKDLEDARARWPAR